MTDLDVLRKLVIANRLMTKIGNARGGDTLEWEDATSDILVEFRRSLTLERRQTARAQIDPTDHLATELAEWLED